MESIINKLYSYLSRGLSRKTQRVLAFFAFTWSLYHGWHLVKFLEANLVRKARNLQLRYGEGSYGLVLDPLTPVGKWFCIELARRSFNLVIMGNDQGKMNNLINECRKVNPKVIVKVLIFDIKKANDETYYDLLFSHIKDLNISLLVVNNVSINKERFATGNPNAISELLFHDCYSTLFVYRKVIPSMLGRAGRSGIIVVSGFQALVAYEYSPIMTSTRVFRNYLSRSLAIEYSNKLDILTVTPFGLDQEACDEEEPVKENINGHLETPVKHSQILDGLEMSGTDRLTKRKGSEDIHNRTTEDTRIVKAKSAEPKSVAQSNSAEVAKSEKSIVARDRAPFWRRVTARAFVIACLQQLSFEKKSRGHWKHDLLSLFTSNSYY